MCVCSARNPLSFSSFLQTGRNPLVFSSFARCTRKSQKVKNDRVQSTFEMRQISDVPQLAKVVECDRFLKYFWRCGRSVMCTTSKTVILTEPFRRFRLSVICQKYFETKGGAHGRPGGAPQLVKSIKNQGISMLFGWCQKTR